MERNRRSFIVDIPLALLAGFMITIAGVVTLAFCLLLFSISEEMVEGGILIIYIVSCFVAGVIIGRRRKYKRFLWGMFLGVAYYTVLSVVSMQIVGLPQNEIVDVVSSLVVCCGSATLGGMLS